MKYRRRASSLPAFPGTPLTYCYDRLDDRNDSLGLSYTCGRGLPGATVRARIPSVARSAPSEMTGNIAASFQLWSTDDQS